MPSGKTPKLSPSEAIRLARKLGWTVKPKRRSGDYTFTTPSGERYTSRAPGRADRVPFVLAKALYAATDGREDPTDVC